MGVFESNEGSQNHLHESCSLARELQHIRIGDPSEQYNSRNSDQHAFFIEVVPQLVNYNISKFEIPRSSITPEIQHAFFIEVVPQIVNYNISKFEIPRSSITPEIQIFETSQQLRNLQESDCHVWSFNTLISVAQTEMVPS
ncbi:uncharacterized protein [Malus domestica]|uniref:uncharacterized protein isoform X1 n=1 Tax=Malus domestica TaxID=3750 RepID=UPI003976812B